MFITEFEGVVASSFCILPRTCGQKLFCKEATKMVLTMTSSALYLEMFNKVGGGAVYLHFACT
jgi:hypothetical protein